MGFGLSKEQKNEVNENNNFHSLEKNYEYGSFNIPLGLKTLNLDEDLYQYLSSLDIFTCDEITLQSKYRFNYCIDYPNLKNHLYYEGYFHSKRTEIASKSINPRMGHNFDKPPAPKELRAFFIAFREKNKLFFTSLRKLLLQSKNETGKHFAMFFDVNGQFFEHILGDLAIQFHCGDQVKENNLGWHVDARNSLFHMAVSIKGKRSLHSRRSKEQNKTPLPEVIEEQNEGDIYVASPALFLHSVEYPQSTWETRTIAIQARFLLDQNQVEMIYPPFEEPNDKLNFGEAIAVALGNFPLVLPSLKEVLVVVDQLKDFDFSVPDLAMKSPVNRWNLIVERSGDKENNVDDENDNEDLLGDGLGYNKNIYNNLSADKNEEKEIED